jgi:hypothetical protein
MTSLSTKTRSWSPLFTTVFGGVVLCWLLAAFLHLYFFGFASMDSWTLTAPAATAKTPFVLTTPFLGTFEGADKAWGLHWPGGLLLTSIVTPFLPHDPATYITISIFYWLLVSLAATALVQRLTGAPWLALCAFVLVASDRMCFSVAWFERYELLGGAIAIAAIMAVCNGEQRHAGMRSVIIGVTFFLLPLIHPVFSGVGLAFVGWLGLTTLALKRPWKPFCIAAAGYAAGWGVFLGYYWSRPWLYAQFLNHAHQNLEITRNADPPGLRTFFRHLSEIDRPTRAGALVYVIAFGGVIYLVCGLWKARGNWREFLSREYLGVFSALGLVSSLLLSQTTYNPYYWATAWPFAAVVACMVAHWLLQGFPARRRLVVGVLVAILLLHGSFWAGRTWIWHKTGFVNLRAGVSQFAASLPEGAQLFIPEVMWDNYAGGNRKVFLNSLPYSAGAPAQQRYASYIGPLMRSGDVLVIDDLQSHASLIDPHQAGWKEIGHSAITYPGEDKAHGFELTAYQKQ